MARRKDPVFDEPGYDGVDVRPVRRRTGTASRSAAHDPRHRRTPLRSARAMQDEFARQQMRRNLASAFGLVLVALSAALAAALATWTVNDPSWNHQAEGPVRNVLGATGATVADLVIQFIGLAAAAFFLPVVAWGWQMVMGKSVPVMRARLFAWVGGTLFLSTFLALLPVPGSWPLPTGLGGVIGDRMLALLTAGGHPVGLSWWLAFALFAAFAAGGLYFSSGLRAPFAGREEPERGDGEAEDADEDGARGLGGLFQQAMGAFHHARLAAAARTRRAEPLMAAGGTRSGARRRPVPVGVPDDDDVETFQAGRPGRAGRDNPAAAPANGRQMQRRAYEEPQAMPASRRSDPPRDAYAHQPFHDEDQPPFDPDEGFDNAALEDEDFPPVELAPKGNRPQPGFNGYSERLVTRGPAANSRLHSGQSPQPARLMRGEVSRNDTAGRAIRVEQIARPQPGRRDVRERQGRLLPDDDFVLPPIQLLAETKPGQQIKISSDALEQNARILEGVLDDFGVKGEIVNVRPGPVVTLYELEPAPGIKSSRVIGLADDIARSMSAIAARVAVIPGKNAIGIELPNARRETVFLRELISSQDFEKSKGKLAICLGKTIGGEPVIVDLARMPHVLVAGTTGSGKSVSINTMILSLLYRLTPEECRLIMIDPKMLELSVYDGIPHLLTPVVTDPKKAVVALKWTVREMEERYRKMSKLGVRNIDGFNARVAESVTRGETITRTVQTGFDRHTGEPIFESEDMDLTPLPYIVVIIDEMADLMMVAGKEIEGAVQRLAQMARAAGIHVIMATQRPSVDVITGTIKANFPTRISFQVTSKIDSRTILGEQGAEQLLGQGDMLYMAGGGRIQRVHGPFVSDQEVEDIVAHLKAQGSPDYIDSVTAEDDAEGEEDGEEGTDYGSESGDLYDQAVAIVLRDKRPTTSYIQRRLGVGYNKAASMIEQMEKEGLISAPKAGGKRDILVRNPDEDY